MCIKSSQDSQKVLQSRCKLLCVTCKLYVKDSIYKSTCWPPLYCTGIICDPSETHPNAILSMSLWTNAWGNIFYNVHFTSEDWPKKSVSSKFKILGHSFNWRPRNINSVVDCLVMLCLVYNLYNIQSIIFIPSKSLSLNFSNSTNSAGPQSCANVKCIFKIFIK